MLIAALFCLMQLILYMLAFFPDSKQKLAGILIPIISVIALLSVKPSAEMGSTQTLPDAPAFSDEATISIDDESIANAFFSSPGDGVIFLSAHEYGTATITVVDGEETVQYTLEIYYEDGAPQTRITPVG